MNDYISTGSRFAYNNDKKRWARAIAFEIRQARLLPMQRVYVRWTWFEKSKRRDPDNFSSIGKKFIFDALKETGIIPNDGWTHIAGWSDRWEVNATQPGVFVELEEVR
jgi:hypothetical protein